MDDAQVRLIVAMRLLLDPHNEVQDVLQRRARDYFDGLMEIRAVELQKQKTEMEKNGKEDDLIG